MAESAEGFDRRRAVSLLQEATKLIAECSESAGPFTITHSTTQNGMQRTAASSSGTSTSIASTFGTASQRALGNFRNLFAPYQNNRRSLCSSNQSSSKPNKRRKHADAQFKRETWTHTFFCLANHEQSAPPTLVVKTKLQEAGLGRKKICFNWKANAIDVKAKLEEVYPKLKDGGGFEILRRGAQPSELILIQPPYSGYSVPFLRDTSGLGQAIAFIRPIQCNLSMLPAAAVDSHDDSGPAPAVQCFNCKADISINEIRQHQQSCCECDEIIETMEIEVEHEIDVPGNGATCSSDKLQDCAVPTVECDDCHEKIHVGETMEHNNICPGGTSTILGERQRVGKIATYLQTIPVDRHEQLTNFSEADVNNIKVILPTLPTSKICTALTVTSGDVQEAVDLLLLEHGDQFDACCSGENLNDLLGQLQPNAETPKRLTIRRDSIFEDSIAFFKQHSFNFSARIKVTFEGEPAIDGGGPVREFFTILMRKLLSSSTSVHLFEGRNSFFLPIHNTDALRSNLFKVAGRMVTASICHGGPGFPVLSKAVYAYFLNPNPDDACKHISQDDVIDLDILDALTKLENLKQEDVTTLAGELQGMLIEAGFPHLLTFGNRFQAMMSLCMHSVILSRKAELDQFMSGLGPLLNVIRRHPDTAEPLLVVGRAKPLTDEDFLSLVEYDGVDDKRKEFFKHYLCTECERLSGLLMFATGCRAIPPMGFVDPPTITILQNESMFPNANTCPLELEIPGKVDTYEEFKQNMDCALDSQQEGFGII